VPLNFTPVPEDKDEVKSDCRQEEYPIAGPAEVSLKKRGDTIGAPEAQCQKNQSKHGIDFTFNPSDTPLNFVVHDQVLSAPRRVNDAR
jgi:hypothetical protein